MSCVAAGQLGAILHARGPQGEDAMGAFEPRGGGLIGCIEGGVGLSGESGGGGDG